MIKKHILKSDKTSINYVISLIEEICISYNLSDNKKKEIIISITEGINNAIYHGNKQNIMKQIEFEYLITENNLDILISDEGDGFEHTNVINPIEQENIDKPNGRGIFLMKYFADKIEYRKNGSELLMSFLIN